MTVRIPPEISDKLAVLSRDTKRSKAYLAGEAIASYVERNAWQVARIKASLMTRNQVPQAYHMRRSRTG